MYQYLSKLNRLFALIFLVVLSPILMITAILVWIFIDRKIIFVQARVGLHNKIFNCYKFASMQENGLYQGNLRSDLETFRINTLGQLLRKYFLDELPQLVNVLKGDMNFIGPRPHATYDHEVFQKQVKAYRKRHHIKPGITGLAQANGYNGPIKNVHQLFKRTSHDLLYIKKQNFLLDLQIILNTLFIPFLKKENDKESPYGTHRKLSKSKYSSK